MHHVHISLKYKGTANLLLTSPLGFASQGPKKQSHMLQLQPVICRAAQP